MRARGKAGEKEFRHPVHCLLHLSDDRQHGLGILGSLPFEETHGVTMRKGRSLRAWINCWQLLRKLWLEPSIVTTTGHWTEAFHPVGNER
jgi:hypothetical protein